MLPEFINALECQDLKRLKSLPKADFHIHGGLGAQFDDVCKVLNFDLPKPPKKLDSIDDLNQYIINHLVTHYRKNDNYKKVLTLAIENALDDGVKILEMSLDIGILEIFDYNYYEYIDFVNNLKNRFKQELDFRPELGISKDYNLDKIKNNIFILLESNAFQAIDLYGNELIKDFSDYKEIYTYALGKNIKRKAHVGEFGSADDIVYAIKTLNLNAVQHGISASQSKKVMDFLKNKGTVLNICPTSNLVLGRVQSLQNHPIQDLYRYGINVTINSDDILLFHQSVSQEYLNLYNSGTLTAIELEDIHQKSLYL